MTKSRLSRAPSAPPGRASTDCVIARARDRTRIILEKLGDRDIDEDDMPDALKETLRELLYLPEVSLCSHSTYLRVS